MRRRWPGCPRCGAEEERSRPWCCDCGGRAGATTGRRRLRGGKGRAAEAAAAATARAKAASNSEGKQEGRRSGSRASSWLLPVLFVCACVCIELRIDRVRGWCVWVVSEPEEMLTQQTTRTRFRFPLQMTIRAGSPRAVSRRSHEVHVKDHPPSSSTAQPIRETTHKHTQGRERKEEAQTRAKPWTGCCAAAKRGGASNATVRGMGRRATPHHSHHSTITMRRRRRRTRWSCRRTPSRSPG